MMPMKDMFYGMAEPVWIMSHSEFYDTDEEDSEAGSENELENTGYSPRMGTPRTTPRTIPRITRSPYYRYHPDGHYFAGPGYRFDDTSEQETEIVMKVPICCGECEDSVKVALYDRLEGVKSVRCDIDKERVTVIATAGAPASVLMECKKIFKKSRMWSDDD